MRTLILLDFDFLGIFKICNEDTNWVFINCPEQFSICVCWVLGSLRFVGLSMRFAILGHNRYHCLQFNRWFASSSSSRVFVNHELSFAVFWVQSVFRSVLFCFPEKISSLLHT